MLVTGPAGSGRTDALAARLIALSDRGVPPDRVLCLTRTRAGASRLRDRVDDMLEGPHEELTITTFEAAAARLLSEYALEARLDPFFATLGRADRLALVLDHLDQLPLRRHEIRGNPAGLLRRLLARIDTVKREGLGPSDLRERARALERGDAGAADRELARREAEFADLYERHDALLRSSGGLDAADAILTLARLLEDRRDVRSAIAERFPFLLVDELEEAAGADRRLIDAIALHRNVAAACDPAQSTHGLAGGGNAALSDFRARFRDAELVELPASVRTAGPVAEAGLALRALVDGAGAGGAVPPDEHGAASLRLWRCSDERAQAQAAAREVEHLIASGTVRPERICVIAGSGWREARVTAAAFEERGVPVRFLGDAALYGRPEVRDALAWLRLLADPTDSAAVVRALTRPPVELRSVDLARCSTIARRRKLDMVSAVEAALESPQLGPEARDRIQAFLRLRGAAEAAMEEMRPDAFVRRLIERVGLRRQRLFAATPEAAERLQSLSRLAERASEWARREPRGSVRDFIRQLSAIADAGDLDLAATAPPAPGAAVIAEAPQVKGLEFDHVYLLGLTRSALGGDPALGYLAATRARRALVASWPDSGPDGATAPSPAYEAIAAVAGDDAEVHEEELFGPAEGLHATYRMVRDEVLEASWRAGSSLSEMRLDTPADVDAAVARYLELLKLAALIQRPGTEPAAEALAALNELIARVATPEQRAALEASPLDSVRHRRGARPRRAARARRIAARAEPRAVHPPPWRRAGALGIGPRPLPHLPAQVQVRPRLRDPAGADDQPAVRDPDPPGPRALPQRGAPPGRRGPGIAPGSLDRLLALFEAGWRRTGFGSSDDELQYRDRAVAALARYHERHERAESRPVWLERSFAFAIGPHQLRGRVDRVDRLPDGGYELIDYKTGEAKGVAALADDVQIALYRLGAREAWEVTPESGSYWYVLDDERVTVPTAPDDSERVERTVLEVAAGIEAQDFEPRPSYEICSWCDYRLICPASEA